MRYKVLDHPAEGLARILGMRYGLQLWSSGAARKASKCAVCGQDIQAGALAFRPLANGNNRADRICKACVDKVSITK